jgi:hypothetical protein
MSLTIRKVVVLGLIGSICLLGNILFVANWLAEHGVVDWARGVRAEYLTGTAVTIIVVLLILLVSPRAGALVRRDNIRILRHFRRPGISHTSKVSPCIGNRILSRYCFLIH